MDTQKEQLFLYIDKHHQEYEVIAKEIFDHPETSNHEYFARDLLAAQLEKHGFEVVKDVAGHPTGFTAVKKAEKAGPVIAFLAEYDALVGLGHGCGHNLIGTISTLSAIALSKELEALGGEIRVYGTPGEEGGENGSSKASFVAKGFFKDIDVALEVHPEYRNAPTPKSLALDSVDIEFFGKAAHAGSAPEKGINALDALILTYNGINAMRQHVTSDVRIHGIIIEGGKAPNIVPDHTRARFYLRAETSKKVNELYDKVEKIVEGSAIATGCTYKMGLLQNKVDNIIPNAMLDALYKEALVEMGEEYEEEVFFPSTDAGNVSQVVPLLHPLFKITTEQAPLHTEAFLNACGSKEGIARLSVGAKLLASIGLRLMKETDTLKLVQERHRQLLADREI